MNEDLKVGFHGGHEIRSQSSCVVGATGVEPVTSSLSWKRSYQLSYAPSYRGDYTGALPFVDRLGGASGLRRPPHAQITPPAPRNQPMPKMTQATPKRTARPPANRVGRAPAA